MTCLFRKILSFDGFSGMLFPNIITLNTPTVICHHMDIQRALIPVFYNFKVLVKAFTLLASDTARIFFRKLVPQADKAREFGVLTLLIKREGNHFKINTYDPLVLLIFQKFQNFLNMFILFF